jgi:hypothetical protein
VLERDRERKISKRKRRENNKGRKKEGKGCLLMLMIR